jgi:hypothetical protein
VSAFYLYLVLCDPSVCLVERVNIRFSERECSLAALVAMRATPRPYSTFCVKENESVN